MALLLALAVLPSLAFAQQTSGLGPRQRGGDLERHALHYGDLQLYLMTAAYYASGNHQRALGEIRQWYPSAIERATSALQRKERSLRPVVKSPQDIDFHLVEAAVLLHAEVGLIFLQEQRLRAAKLHLEKAAELQQWSHGAAAVPGLELRESIGGRDFYVALAAAALALGYAEMAGPFAEKARHDALLDPEVHLVLGCAASAVAAEKALLHRNADAARARDAAEKAFRDALALAPDTHEARLRLGKLLLDEGRVIEAEPLLVEVDARTTDGRQRYLARLFLGRAAERHEPAEEAVRAYRSALEAWPDSQAARFGLARALESSAGPAASRELVGATLDSSRRRDGPSDPWFLYPAGPPGLAPALVKRVWGRTLGE